MQLLKPPLLAVNFPLSFPLIRLNIGMDTHYGNPLLDWFNHINFGFIFFLGFAITAAEEHGLGDVMHRARWYYLVAGSLFCWLRVGNFGIRDETRYDETVPFWVVDGLLM